jgi:peptidoglycan/xylan/chitin deacetylase (PgdA/CDA1 family)
MVFALGGDRGVIHQVSCEAPAVALSFDDGPSAENTPALLDLLEANDARATFFVVGERIAGKETILSRAVNLGHELGNHTHRHRHTVHLSEIELRDEITAANDIIAQLNPQVRLVRPPFGKDRRRTSRIAAELGMRVALWSIDSGDARGYAAEKIIATVVGKVRRGSIVLFHDGGTLRPGTLQACAHIVPALREAGFKLVTISELLELSTSQPSQTCSRARQPSS